MSIPSSNPRQSRLIRYALLVVLTVVIAVVAWLIVGHNSHHEDEPWQQLNSESAALADKEKLCAQLRAGHDVTAIADLSSSFAIGYALSPYAAPHRVAEAIQKTSSWGPDKSVEARRIILQACDS